MAMNEMQDTGDNVADAQEFSDRIYVKKQFMPKIIGRNKSNIRKFRKKYAVNIECITDVIDPHFLVSGQQSNVTKAVSTIKSNFGNYVNTPVSHAEVPSARVITSSAAAITRCGKQYDLRPFLWPFPKQVAQLIELYYYQVFKGTVKLWKMENKYGFITMDNSSQDIFVFFKDINKYPKKPKKNRSLQKGERVEFVIVYLNDGRTKAIYVTGPNGRAVRGYADNDGSDAANVQQVKVKKKVIKSRSYNYKPQIGSNVTAKSRNEMTKTRLAIAKYSCRVADKDGYFAKDGAIAVGLCNHNHHKEDQHAKKKASKTVARNKKYLGKHRKRSFRKH